MAELFPGAPIQVSAPRPVDVSAAGRGFVLTANGKRLSVLLVEQPLPRDAYERALSLDRVWPAAAEAMQRQRAHAIVGMVDAAEDHGGALEGAACATLVAAALATLLPALAVIWAAGATITDPPRFVESAKGLARRQLPSDLWVSLAFLDGPPSATGERTLAVLTTGLQPFVGREIEFLPTALSPYELARRVIGLGQYLIQSGPVIRDGETVGITETERIRVRFADGQRRGVPVMALTLEQGDEAPSTVGKSG